MKSLNGKWLAVGIAGLMPFIVNGTSGIPDTVKRLHLQACVLHDDGDYEKAISMWRDVWRQVEGTQGELRYKVASNIALAYVNLWKNDEACDLSMTSENLMLAESYLHRAAKIAGTGFPKEKEILGFVSEAREGIAEKCRERAERGNSDAQHFLGVLYGPLGVAFGHETNYVASVCWARKAAEQGHAKAEAYLGRMYRLGCGVETNYEESVQWCRKSAEHGEPEGQADLGSMYSRGLGVPQDHVEAARWYRKAAEQGYSYAQYMLGQFYNDGCGVKQDHTEAVKWFRKAAAQGHEPAQKALMALGQEVGQDSVHVMYRDYSSNIKQKGRGVHEMTPPLGMVRGIGTIALSPCNLFRAWPLGFEEGDLFVGVILLPVGSTLVMTGCTVCDAVNGVLDVCSFGFYGNWLYTDGYTPWFWQRHNSYSRGIMTEDHSGSALR